MKWFMALWLIIPIGMIVIATVSFVVCLRHLRAMPSWPTRTALVTSLASEEDPEHPGQARPDLTVTYTYRDVNGQEHKGSGPLRVQKNVTVGGTVQIQVDPSDPRRSRPLAAPAIVLKAFLAFSVLLGLAGVVNLVIQVNGLRTD